MARPPRLGCPLVLRPAPVANIEANVLESHSEHTESRSSDESDAPSQYFEKDRFRGAAVMRWMTIEPLTGLPHGLHKTSVWSRPMDLSKLESDAKAFEISVDSWSFWLAIATGLVVVGLVLEYRKDVAEMVRSRPFKWKKLEHLIGAALVTLGVAGELIFQPFMGSAENSLRGVTHQIESLLSKEAGDANERAGNASERAARIEAAAAWRSLPDAAGLRLTVALKSGTGGSVELSYPANDPEALFFAFQIGKTFDIANQSAGKALWVVSVQPRQFSRAIFWGVRVYGQKLDAVRSVQAAFNSANVPHSAEQVPNVLNDSPGMMIGGTEPLDVMVFVGSKQPPI